jgi:hypothetical protein
MPACADVRTMVPDVLGVAPAVFAVSLLAVGVGGFVTGVTGFGFAVVGTALLTAVLDPASAVVVMILPVLGANVSLVRELDAEGLRACVRRFWPFVAAAVVGTVVGMTLLSRVPARPLAGALGVFVLGFVAVSQRAVVLPGRSWLRRRCFVASTPAKVGLGAVSGLVFGATNVGVQVVAYLRSLDLDRATFVGVVAMVFLGVSTVRVGLAWTLGLYGAGGTVALSVVAVAPALLGVAAGRRVRGRVSARHQRAGVFLLLSVVGLRLLARGVGV